MGAKATEGKPEGKPAIGPKRGAAVSAIFMASHTCAVSVLPYRSSALHRGSRAAA